MEKNWWEKYSKRNTCQVIYTFDVFVVALIKLFESSGDKKHEVRTDESVHKWIVNSLFFHSSMSLTGVDDSVEKFISNEKAKKQDTR